MLDATANGYRAIWSIARGVGLGSWYTGGDAEPWTTMYIREPCEGLSVEQCANVLGVCHTSPVTHRPTVTARARRQW